MRRVDLSGSRLRETSLFAANLQGADLGYAQLQGARLTAAHLQGARLAGAQLQGADLFGVALPSADLTIMQLQGAELRDAQLQGAELRGAQLQGADLRGAQLKGARLSVAGLQGADLRGADLNHSVLAKVWIWRARMQICTNARIADLLTDNVIKMPSTNFYESSRDIPLTRDAVAEFIERSIAQIPSNTLNKVNAAQRMREGLVIDPAIDDTEAIAQVWSNCEKAETSTMPQEKFDEQRAVVLRDLVCNESENRMAIAVGIILHWVLWEFDRPTVLSVQLARGLLGQDGNECAATKDFDNATIGKLKEVAAARVIPTTTPEK
jgi:hypothetical protein